VKLIDGWRDLQSGLQHSLLTLEANVLWPTDKAAQIPLGLDVLADAIIPTKALQVTSPIKRIKQTLNPIHLVRFSKSGLTTLLASGFFTANGGAATFLPFLVFV
jgi:hypothetical protein